MANYRLLTGFVICCGFGLTQSASYAQPVMTAAQLDALVKPSLDSCPSARGKPTTARLESRQTDRARIIPAISRRSVAVDRVAKTLNGVWHGEVKGDTSDVHVDYFWIIDTQRNEALILAQRSGKETVPGRTRMANPPKLTYLMCAHEGYSPGTSTPQIHEFTKVSSSTANAAAIVQKATGVTSRVARPTLTDLWQALVKSGYFNNLRYVAYAGGLFKPLRIENVQTAAGPAEVTVKWDAQYRGGGTTKLKYLTNVPMVGSEQARLVGTAARSGDFLVASLGNGAPWKVEVVAGGDYDIAFDQVSLGPLER